VFLASACSRHLLYVFISLVKCVDYLINMSDLWRCSFFCCSSKWDLKRLNPMLLRCIVFTLDLMSVCKCQVFSDLTWKAVLKNWFAAMQRCDLASTHHHEKDSPFLCIGRIASQLMNGWYHDKRPCADSCTYEPSSFAIIGNREWIGTLCNQSCLYRNLYNVKTSFLTLSLKERNLSLSALRLEALATIDFRPKYHIFNTYEELRQWIHVNISLAVSLWSGRWWIH
jgi:hypothetical protein